MSKYEKFKWTCSHCGHDNEGMKRMCIKCKTSKKI